MARRQKTTPLEDLLTLVSLLPWWAGAGLAVASYVVLHAMAMSDAPKPADIHQMGSFFAGTLVRSIAAIGQYLLPPICLLGAGVSAWHHRRRKTLVDTVANSDAADALDGMTWHEFEVTVGEAFRLDGFRVEERGGSGADGGVDLVLYKENEKFFVQCKQWKAYKVGVNVVRELYGVMAAKGAAGGFVVTSGSFTKDAIEFASGRNIVLADGPILFDMIKHAGGVPVGRAAAPAIVKVAQGAGVACPVCGGAMLQRVAKQGANAGKQFWGCSTYPACKGTRAIG